jgi:hypothetical protein
MFTRSKGQRLIAIRTVGDKMIFGNQFAAPDGADLRVKSEVAPTFTAEMVVEANFVSTVTIKTSHFELGDLIWIKPDIIKQAV